MVVNKTQELDKITEDIIADDVCPDLRGGATQLVPGSGNPDSDILFIGEAPGKKEDETGVPFVGAAGKFLDVMLESIDMDREDVFITNIVKYRPPDNRDPLPAEISAFMPYLIRQLAVIRPKVVVTLGRFSMNVFLPNDKIGHIHGQPQRIDLSIREDLGDLQTIDIPKEQIVLMPLYHPAAALYNGGQREVLLEDFSQIPRLLEEISRQ